MIAFKTSNTQKDCDNMEFYVFNNLMIYLTKLIENENGKGEGQEDQETDVNKKFTESMNTAKGMMNKNNFKIPKY